MLLPVRRHSATVLLWPVGYFGAALNTVSRPVNGPGSRLRGTEEPCTRVSAERKLTFSSFGGRPRFRGLCSWALFRGDLELLSEGPEDALFFPSPALFFTFPSHRPSLRFSSPEPGLLLSSLELRRFLSSAELWDDA